MSIMVLFLENCIVFIFIFVSLTELKDYPLGGKSMIRLLYMGARDEETERLHNDMLIRRE